MQKPCLAKDGDHRRLGVYKQLDLRIVFCSNFLAACRAEGGYLSVSPLALGCFLEKLNVLWIAPWPAALDIMHTKGIELLRHAQLVRYRETHTLALRAVTQCRIVDFHGILHQNR